MSNPPFCKAPCPYNHCCCKLLLWICSYLLSIYIFFTRYAYWNLF